MPAVLGVYLTVGETARQRRVIGLRHAVRTPRLLCRCNRAHLAVDCVASSAAMARVAALGALEPREEVVAPHAAYAALVERRVCLLDKREWVHGRSAAVGALTSLFGKTCSNLSTVTLTDRQSSRSLSSRRRICQKEG